MAIHLDKDPRKANLGRAFEEFIEYANARYRMEGKAVIHKIPTKFTPIRSNKKIVNAKPEEKPPMDFMGRFGSKPIAFEAKHTKEKRISLAAVDENQTEWLNDWNRDPEAITFVIVSFGLERFFVVPWDAWLTAREAHSLGRKDMGFGWFGPLTGGEKAHYRWQATGKASISGDEMHPGWEVKTGGTIGLDYLWVIEKFFT